MDFLILHESDVFDKKPQHPLAISSWSTRIVPHTRKIGSQRMDAVPIFIREC